MARPTKYDEETAEKICLWLKEGATRKDAAAAVGVSYDAFSEWVKRFAGFALQVEVAEGECAAKMARRITSAAVSDWKAAEAWLKRRRRDEWGDNVNLDLDKEITGLLAKVAGAGEETIA